MDNGQVERESLSCIAEFGAYPQRGSRQMIYHQRRRGDEADHTTQ